MFGVTARLAPSIQASHAVRLPLLAVLVALSSLLSLTSPEPAQATGGAAQGKVGIVDTPTKVYGFSTYTGNWASGTLDSPGQCRLAGDFLGYVRTAGRLYSYNAMNDTWRYSVWSGVPLGEDVEDATGIFWSSTMAYATATLWITWKTQAFPAGEVPTGGGSAGTFALAWTPHHAYAFQVASGQWIHQPLVNTCVGGIANQGLGMVWTSSEAYSYNAGAAAWVPLDLGNPEGVSVDGSGNVGLVWTASTAQAYSGILDQWVEQASPMVVDGGAASGEIALLWGGDTAWVFDANTGLWSSHVLQAAAGIGGPGVDDPDAPSALGAAISFSVGPNPCSTDLVLMVLPDRGAWQVGIYDAQGRCVRMMEVPEGTTTGKVAWDRLDSSGSPVASGSYWVRAESGGRVEARRVVLLGR